MSRTANVESSPVELATRQAEGIVVSLHWHPETNQLRVSILDCRELDIVAVAVEDGQNPLDVFHHPYAYVRPHAD